LVNLTLSYLYIERNNCLFPFISKVYRVKIPGNKL
jgi:hypothetical protein